MRTRLRACALALLLALPLVAPAQDADSERVDYLELAALLTRDGEYERAEAALAHIDASAPGLDLARYHTVRGLLALGQQRPALAADALAAAVAAGQDDPLVHLQRAQALVTLERHDEALLALDAAGDAVSGIPGAWLLRARAQWLQGQHQAALDTLGAAAERFGDKAPFLRRQVFHLIELGLYQQAADLGQDLLRSAQGSVDDLLAIGTALRRSRSFDAALRFLEAARLREPGNGLVARALAQTWLERGDPLAAAGILAVQAEREPVLFPEAAELFRRAGLLPTALALNARIADQPRKLRQRVGLLVGMRAYEQVAGMEDALYRAGLLADEDVRYALAYAYFQRGSYDAAGRHLDALTRPDLFRKASELRRLMQDCAETRWACT